MAHTVCLVYLVSTVSVRHKNILGRGSAISRHITKLEQSTFLQISMVKFYNKKASFLFGQNSFPTMVRPIEQNPILLGRSFQPSLLVEGSQPSHSKILPLVRLRLYPQMLNQCNNARKNPVAYLALLALFALFALFALYLRNKKVL